jgi:ATP/ADP translocase
MKVVEPAYVWRALPMIMTLMTFFQGLEKNPSLYLISGSLATMKILEFSARRMLDEMVYVPLDYESRYVGKEVIGVFGYRFGKSGMSLALSALTSYFGMLRLQELSQLTVLASGNWLLQAYRLSNCVPTKAEAEKAYEPLHVRGRRKTSKGACKK